MKYLEKKTELTEKFRKKIVPLNDDELKAFLPETPLLSGMTERKRLFTIEYTFFLFLWQTLSSASCLEAVQKALLRLSFAVNRKASPSSSAYCQARSRLPESFTAEKLSGTVAVLKSKVNESLLWYGRNVNIVDGTTVSMADTPENQSLYPQPISQKTGCGFPMMRILAVFSLASGALLSYEKGPLGVGESSMLKKIIFSFSPGDIMLGDRGFCSFALICDFIKSSVDAVVRMRVKMIRNYTVFKKIGRNDSIIKWKRPASLGKDLPGELYLRMIKYDIKLRGFRTQSVTVLTTLCDNTVFPAESFAELYLRRWHAEINLKHLKSTLGMDILKCLSPNMISKELMMHFIVYNLIRNIMLQAACANSTPLKQISFKYSLTITRMWTPWLLLCETEKQEKLIDAMLLYITESLIPDRPFRREPRAVKRRPKPYQLLTSHRHAFMEIQHIKKYRKNPLS